MASQHEIALLLDDAQFRQAARADAEATRAIDKALRELTDSAVGVNSAFQLISGTSSRYAKTAAATKTVQDALTTAGYRSIAQIEEEIRQKQALISIIDSREIPTLNRLKAEIENLRLEQQGVVTATRQAEQAFFGFGFILDDARQFTVDAAAGVRAISNNLQPLIQSLSNVEREGTGVVGFFKGLKSGLTPATVAILTINAATLAMAFLLKNASDEAEELRKKAKSLTSELIKVEEAESVVFAAETRERAEELARAAGELADDYARQIDAVKNTVTQHATLGASYAQIIPLTDEQRKKIEQLGISQQVANDIQKEYNEQLQRRIVLEEIAANNAAIGAQQRTEDERLLGEITDETREYLDELTLLQSIDRETLELNVKQRNEAKKRLDALRVELGLDEDRTRKKREQLTELEKLQKAERELTTAIEGTTRGVRDEIITLESGNRILDRRKEIVEAVRGEQLKLRQELEEAVVLGVKVSAEGQVSGAAIDLLENLFPSPEKLNERSATFKAHARVSLLEAFRFAQGDEFAAVLDEALPGNLLAKNLAAINASVDQFGSAFTQKILERYGDESGAVLGKIAAFNDRLNATIVSGLAQTIGASVEALASGENIGNVLLKTLGSLAVRVGSLMIGFGIAGLKLRTLITNPVAAIAAGAALVALGTLARRAVSTEVSRTTGQGAGRGPFGGGGFGSTGTGGGLFVPGRPPTLLPPGTGSGVGIFPGSGRVGAVSAPGVGTVFEAALDLKGAVVRGDELNLIGRRAVIRRRR